MLDRLLPFGAGEPEQELRHAPSARPPVRLPAVTALVILALASCTSGGKKQPARTEAERDSILANSAIPGAGAVKAARATQDSARARAEAESAIE